MLNCQRSLFSNPELLQHTSSLHSSLPLIKITPPHVLFVNKYLFSFLANIVIHDSAQMAAVFQNRCAPLSFSRALCGWFNRVIHFGISVFSPLFAARFCMTAPADRLQHTGRCISQFSAPGLRKRALALLRKVQAKWAPLPLALSTVVLEPAAVSKKVVEGWHGDLLLKWKRGQIWWADLFMGLEWTANEGKSSLFFLLLLRRHLVVLSFKNVFSFSQEFNFLLHEYSVLSDPLYVRLARIRNTWNYRLVGADISN